MQPMSSATHLYRLDPSTIYATKNARRPWVQIVNGTVCTEFKDSEIFWQPITYVDEESK